MTTFLLISCNGSEQDFFLVSDGEYNGTFTVEYNSGNTFSNPVTLMFSGRKYSSTSGSDRIPAGGSGTFQVTDGSVIFTDVNYWTAEFDWNLILTGEYAVSETDTEITLTKELDDFGTYTYRLIKDAK